MRGCRSLSLSIGQANADAFAEHAAAVRALQQRDQDKQLWADTHAREAFMCVAPLQIAP